MIFYIYFGDMAIIGKLMDKNRCEYWNGIVHEGIVEREVFKNKNGFVILKNVPIGICNKCGSCYYSTKVLHEVDDVASGRRKAEEEVVPIAEYA